MLNLLSDAIYWLRILIGVLSSSIVILFGFVMVVLFTAVQIIIMPRTKWVNPLQIYKNIKFTNVTCTLMCSISIFIINFMSTIQKNMESDFCEKIKEI